MYIIYSKVIDIIRFDPHPFLWFYTHTRIRAYKYLRIYCIGTSTFDIGILNVSYFPRKSVFYAFEVRTCVYVSASYLLLFIQNKRPRPLTLVWCQRTDESIHRRTFRELRPRFFRLSHGKTIIFYYCQQSFKTQFKNTCIMYTSIKLQQTVCACDE